MTMPQRIDKIENSKHKQERVLVFLEGGDLIKITKAELLRFGLKQGMELEDSTIEELKGSAKKSEIRVAGAQMASKRILSKKEIVQRLKKKGADEAEAQETADWLEELGAVDDAAYAGVICRHYVAMGYGPGRIRQELQKRGVDKAYWEDALASLPDQKETIDAYIQKKLNGKEADQATIKKISDGLMRRGFSWNDIRQALNRLGEKVEEDL